jgi:hypothetical protein
LSLPLEEILAEVKILEQETKQLKYNLSKLCWYMRGGLSLTEAYETTHEDREVITKLIEENLETAKKINQPFW